MAGKISVTGMGVICAIGNDLPSVLDSLRSGRSGIRPMKYLQSRHSELPVGEVQKSNSQMKELLGITDPAPMSRTSLMGALAIREALAQAAAGDLSGKRVALISGTTVGGMDVTEQYFEQMKSDDSLLGLPQSNDCGKSTDEMARMAGLDKALTCTISTACSSALNSIILGAEMLARDEVDIVIAGGSEALSRFHLNGFNTLMILDHEPCRPFDATRAGLNLGEGAGFLVLEKDAGERSLAYVAGYGNRCDAFHQTASSENGEGPFLAMGDALSMAGLQPEEIQYINAHGTGTPNNDPSESQAIRRLFGDHLPEISSTKGFTGHTTSASGSIEAIFCILAMRHGFIPANMGFGTPDPACILPSGGRGDARLENVICNSFGFGGNDSSLILSSREPREREAGAEYELETAADLCVSDLEQLKELKEFNISPMESRRMGKLMKASQLSALKALKEAGVECPDAIITATAHGMLETSMQFLEDIEANGEELLKPTLFMQSTHNTLSSAIAIRLHCHGYNITYSHGQCSMDWAMRDAERLIRTGKAKTVLVGHYDESTALFDSFAIRAGKEAPKPLYARSVVLKRK